MSRNSKTKKLKQRTRQKQNDSQRTSSPHTHANSSNKEFKQFYFICPTNKSTDRELTNYDVKIDITDNTCPGHSSVLAGFSLTKIGPINLNNKKYNTLKEALPVIKNNKEFFSIYTSLLESKLEWRNFCSFWFDYIKNKRALVIIDEGVFNLKMTISKDYDWYARLSEPDWFTAGFAIARYLQTIQPKNNPFWKL